MKPLRHLLERHPLPDSSGGKDANGTVLIIGGPPTCPGAVMLAGTAALRLGSGRVQLVVHPDVSAAAATAVPETKVLGWDQETPPPPEVRSALDEADVVVVGPGHAEMKSDVVGQLAALVDGAHFVLDAGALRTADALSRTPGLVLAPNTDEAGRLLGREDSEAALAPKLAASFGSPVAVRGAVTVVADGSDAWLFDDGPAGLGTPGSGDVFIGTLAGLLACGAEPLAALGWAVALHAEAGARLARDTPAGYLASEIVRELPFARAQAAAASPGQ